MGWRLGKVGLDRALARPWVSSPLANRSVCIVSYDTASGFDRPRLRSALRWRTSFRAGPPRRWIGVFPSENSACDYRSLRFIDTLSRMKDIHRNDEPAEKNK